MDTKENIKIIWIHSHFLYWMGGTKFVFDIIRRVAEKYQIEAVVENSTADSIKKYGKINVKVINISGTTSNNPIYWALLPLMLLRDYLVIKRIVSEEEQKANKVYLVSSMFPMNVVALMLRRKHIQYCFEPFAFFHDPEFIKGFSVTKRSFIKVAAFFWRWLDIFATKRANNVITLNNTTSEVIRKTYGIKPLISYTGIDTLHFRPFVSKGLRERYHTKRVIVHSTDFTPVKGTENMIKIFSKVNDRIPNSHLLITSTIENQSEEQRLKLLAKRLGILKNVNFLGFVDYDLLPQIYSLAKVLVQCSYSERSGTTSMALPVKEAMACGTLCIRYPIINEDVEDGKTGFLVDPRKKNEMVEKICAILRMSPRKYRIASNHARKYIVERYNWNNTVNMIESALDKLS